ncbi:MAG: hypothetical protein IJ212_05080 [Bacteroidaceae bacterium]|nr:hypothetical protein [Bacteroidaceae bacterium]
MAGCQVGFVFKHINTAKYLGEFVHKVDCLPDQANYIEVKDVDYKDWQSQGNQTINDFAEYSLLPIRTSDLLLSMNRCVFHAVAFKWQERAWLIAALPGTGKSTQYKNLKELYPNEISIINGDKPILEVGDKGIIMVHPSPWNGKEVS